MTPKKARVMANVLSIVTVVCGVIGIISIIGAAGTSDFYVLELHEAVPGNKDMKMAMVAFIFMLVAYAGIKIMERIDFDIMYDLESVPLCCTETINDKASKNVMFNRQLNEALDRFYNCDWGKVSRIDKEDNDSALDDGYGRIVGEYHTMLGNIFIITEKDRSSTTVMFAEEY